MCWEKHKILHNPVTGNCLRENINQKNNIMGQSFVVCLVRVLCGWCMGELTRQFGHSQSPYGRNPPKEPWRIRILWGVCNQQRQKPLTAWETDHRSASALGGNAFLNIRLDQKLRIRQCGFLRVKWWPKPDSYVNQGSVVNWTVSKGAWCWEHMLLTLSTLKSVIMLLIK